MSHLYTPYKSVQREIQHVSVTVPLINHILQACNQKLRMGVLFCVRKNLCDHTHLLGHAHQINNAKATKKCVPSGRNGDVLVVKSVIFRI